MSNQLRPTRSITGRLGLLAAAAGILTTSLAIGSVASAQSPDRFAEKPPAPAPIVVDDFKLPTISTVPSIPLPCLGWWCNISFQPLPDYVAGYDAIPEVNRWYRGRKAVPYYVRINNIGNADPGAVWTTLASPDGEILAVENVQTWRTDISVEPVSRTARRTAPFAASFLDDAWLVQDRNGIPAHSGYADMVYVRVWMAGWDRPELIVSANDHVGVEELGALTPTGYRHHEVTRANNRVTFAL
jgi:hypothetical protein